MTPLYSERLKVPTHWWLTPVFFVVVIAIGTEQYLGLAWSVLVTGALVGGVVAFLLRYGALEVAVDGEGLRAGPHHLPRAALGAAHPLDAEQARLLRGPRSDARALIVLRGYVPAAIRVDVVDPTSRAPYWYVSTRHPQQLAAALDAARTWQADAAPDDRKR